VVGKPIRMSRDYNMLLIFLRRVLVERQINVRLTILKISDGEVKSELTSIFLLPNR
jgi:hypothetical protein